MEQTKHGRLRLPVWLSLFIAIACVYIGCNLIPSIRTKLIDFHITKDKNLFTTIKE
jgi:hypothetical protein